LKELYKLIGIYIGKNKEEKGVMKECPKEEKKKL